jgi:hypothetical protein
MKRYAVMTAAIFVFAAVIFSSVVSAVEKLKSFDDQRRISVWVDPETKCHYLIVSAYGGNGGPNSFAITPRMRPTATNLHAHGSKHWCD